MKKYYVYAHINPLTGKTFYIGKGTGNRLYIAERNPMHTRYVKGYLAEQGLTFEAKILHICDDEAEALEKEALEINSAVIAGHILLNRQLPATKIQPEAVYSALSSEDNMPDSNVSLSMFVKNRRKSLKLTQPELANKAGVGLRFLRELESDKKSLRLDKINDVLRMFGSCLVPYKRS